MRFEVPWRTDVVSVCCHADGPMVVRCPKCGSDRLIPLTFGAVLGTEDVDLQRRPVAKCAACGERTYVTAKVHRSLTRD
jgi:DNA-directed RNA polymerase subunit RPC12/RpoP